MEETLKNSKNDFNQIKNCKYNTQEQSEAKSSAISEIPLSTEDSARVRVNFIIDLRNNFSTSFRRETTIETMKKRVADVLDIDENEIKLKWKNKDTNDFTCLSELVENPLVPVNINLHHKDSHLGIEKLNENIPSLNVITVHLRCAELENVTVAIENQSVQKEWLGGYRNKLNGTDYHHAVAQTTREYALVGVEAGWFHRSTQTTGKLKTTGMATVTSRGTQMTRCDHYITSANDKIITTRPRSLCKRDNAQLMHAKARVIQRCWRAYCQKRLIVGIISQLKQQRKTRDQIIEEIALEHSLQDRLILTGAVYPTKRDDFTWLHLGLGIFLEKKKRKYFLRTDCSRKALLNMMFTREIDCLYRIETHKIENKKEVLKKEKIRLLEKAAKPTVFKNKRGNLVSLYDLNTQRARDLKEVYAELIKREVQPAERIDFLNTFKKMFTCTYSTYEHASEIVSLVDREISLISLGMRDKDLKGVRMRIEQLYMHFAKQEEFNPKAAKHEKSNSTYLCVHCKGLFPVSKFPVYFTMKSFSVCLSCKWIYDIGHMHTDLAPYKKLLKQVRWDETAMCSRSGACFLLQPLGMAYLTTKIWHSCSAISQCYTMRTLRHVRWLRDEDWSPWNTILLTAEEAQFHSFIPNVYEFYQPLFIEKVHIRHIMAQCHFKDLKKVNKSMYVTGNNNSPKELESYFLKQYAGDFIS